MIHIQVKATLRSTGMEQATFDSIVRMGREARDESFERSGGDNVGVDLSGGDGSGQSYGLTSDEAEEPVTSDGDSTSGDGDSKSSDDDTRRSSKRKQPSGGDDGGGGGDGDGDGDVTVIMMMVMVIVMVMVMVMTLLMKKKRFKKKTN
jgi:hypothetical protein